MDESIPQEILHDLLASFEALETQTVAVLEFLKAKGIASEEELAPYFEQAGKASDIRWRAARVRMDRLISSAIKAAETDLKKEPPKNDVDHESRPAPEVKSRGKEAEETKQTQTEKNAPRELEQAGKDDSTRADGDGKPQASKPQAKEK